MLICWSEWRAISTVRGWECFIPLLLPPWGLRKRWSWVLSELHNDSQKLQQEEFWADLRKNPLTAGLVQYWNGLSREALESLSLKIFNPSQGKAPRNLIRFWSWPCFEQEIGPSNLQRSLLTYFFPPCDSVTLSIISFNSRMKTLLCSLVLQHTFDGTEVTGLLQKVWCSPASIFEAGL